MLEVKPDIKKNRLYLKISGKVTKKDLDKLYTDLRFCVADLQPGFDVLSDFSECKIGNLNGLPTFRKISNYLVANGVKNVVRVLPQKELIFNQIMNLASKVQGYNPTYVSSIEEAEQHLSTAATRKGTRIQLHFHPIEYTVSDGKGQGEIIDISTSGCAVGKATLQPALITEIEVKFTLMNQGDTPDDFEIKGKVVKAGDSSFAVEFLGMNATTRDRLWACLVYESQQSIDL